MINFSSWSIKNPTPVSLFFIMLTLFGLFSFVHLKVQNMPEIDFPVVIVTAIYPGATPSTLETEVANKIENSVASVAGVKHTHVNLSDGVATIIIELNFEINMVIATEEIRSAISAIRSTLPAQMREPIVTKMDFSAQALLAYAVSSEQRDDENLSRLIDNIIYQRLTAVKGVGKVARVGGVDKEIHIELDPVRLNALGVTATDISRQLKMVYAENVAGKVTLSGTDQMLRVLAKLDKPNDLARLEIPLADGRSIRLGDLGTVKDSIAEKKVAAYLNGKSVVGFEISPARKADNVKIAIDINKALEELQKQYPDLKFAKTFDFAEVAKDEFDASMKLLYEGALLTIIVVWIFLRDMRATIISSISLPVSIVAAFIGMYLFDFSINIVSLLALSLVVGILVDDAIVEVENVSRHLRMDKTPYQASMEASNEIGLAVIATTSTLIAVFLPTAFMPGIGGMFFRQFGWTAAMAVFASLVVARLLTPMMAAYLMKPITKEYHDPVWLTKFMQISKWCLQYRAFTITAAVVFFILSITLIPLLPTGFTPPDNNEHTQIQLELPPGRSLNDMQKLVAIAEQRLKQNKYIERIYSTIGGGSAGADAFAGHADPSKATITMRLIERNKRPLKTKINKMLEQDLADLPGARVSIGLGASNDKYKLTLVGDDIDTLTKVAHQVQRQLHTIPGIGGVTSDASLERTEVAVTIDFAKAADLGVTSSAIAETLQVATSGDLDEFLPKFNLPNRQVPIVVKLNKDARQDLKILENLYVPGSNRPVRLGEIASLSLSSGPAFISHYDKKRNIMFTIKLGDYTLGDLQKVIMELPAMKNLPESVKSVDVGDAEGMAELFAGFAMAMLAGGLIIYIVLVLLFKDFLQPFTILLALPLSLGGSFVALLVAQQSFSLSSLIGLVMLMGIATKNSILLVEYAIMAYRDFGMSRTDAILDACHKRARPIIMTTLAMSAGMLPIALQFGSSDMSFRSPMAITVIGGLITSTILSLLIIPAAFTYVDDFSNWLKRRFV